MGKESNIIIGAGLLYFLLILAFWGSCIYMLYRFATSQTVSAVIGKSKREIIEWSNQP